MLVQVAAVGEIAAVEASGAEGVVAGAGAHAEIAAATSLPVLAGGDSPDGAEGADAWLLVAERHEDNLEEQYAAAQSLGLECVVDVQDDEELALVLECIAPEIILLSPRGADAGEDAVDRVLELLPDVPAGMLAIAELRSATADDVRALERAGVDAVLVDVSRLEAVAEAAS